MRSNEYRNIAADCIRHAVDQTESSDRLWATLAQSWLRLAEQAEQTGYSHVGLASDGEPYEDAEQTERDSAD